MKRLLFILFILSAACGGSSNQSDAYGNFEATEVTVSAGHSGKVLQFDVEEGNTVEKDAVIGLVDTAMLHLQKQQLKIKGEVLRAKFPNISTELAVLEEQRANLSKEVDRFSKLAEKGVTPQKQVDDLKDQISVLNKRVEAVKSQNKPLAEELELIRVQLKQLDLQIADAMISSPLSGTLLLKQIETGEMVSTGMPLFRVADLSSLILRAYVSGTQLDDFQLNQEVTVLTDSDEESFNRYTGTITWISDEAEFTPKIIQTKEERTDLVYAIKIRVPNDGRLKIGMPAEVIFNPNSTDRHD